MAQPLPYPACESDNGTLRFATAKLEGDVRSGQAGSTVSGDYKSAERYGCGWHVRHLAQQAKSLMA